MSQRFEDYSRPLEYAGPGQMKKGIRARTLVMATIASLLGFGLLASVLIPTPHQSMPLSNRVKCASNMRQIGLAIAFYAKDHKGEFPDDLKTVLENEDITAATFVCPESNDTPAFGTTTQATAAAILQPGHVSYIYLGNGLTTATARIDTVILYEPLSNHASAGMNVMFGDFHVEWLTAAEATATLKRQAAETRGVTQSPDTMPATTSSSG